MAVVRLRPADLRDALRSDGTSLQFQVQVHVPTSALSGVEAFVRWPHPVLGMVGPQEIAQLVAQGVLYVAFDEWVIRTATAQAAKWIAAGVALPLISVNVWEETLRSPDLPRILQHAERLELELPRGAVRDPSLAATAAITFPHHPQSVTERKPGPRATPTGAPRTPPCKTPQSATRARASLLES